MLLQQVHFWEHSYLREGFSIEFHEFFDLLCNKRYFTTNIIVYVLQCVCVTYLINPLICDSITIIELGGPGSACREAVVVLPQWPRWPCPPPWRVELLDEHKVLKIRALCSLAGISKSILNCYVVLVRPSRFSLSPWHVMWQPGNAFQLLQPLNGIAWPDSLATIAIKMKN